MLHSEDGVPLSVGKLFHLINSIIIILSCLTKIHYILICDSFFGGGLVHGEDGSR